MQLLAPAPLRGEGVARNWRSVVRRLQNPSPPDPLSPKRGEGEKSKDGDPLPLPEAGRGGEK